jgi:hypothetical protein
MPLLLVAAMVTPAAADPEPAGGSIVLRVYNVYGLTESELASARVTVRDVFKAAGVETTWLNCPAQGECRERLRANEFIVRLIRSPHGLPVSSPDLTLGVSLVQSELSSGSFTTVYPDRVGAIAARFGREQDLLLGRAIAHELGHLLLGMTAHSPGGLMRARWSERRLQAAAPADWIFSEIEARKIRDVILSRSLAPRPADHLAAVSVTSAVATKSFVAH